MKQLNVMDLFDKITIQESNNETEEFEKGEVISERVTEKSDEHINELNGIVEIKNKSGIYKTWTIKLIRPFIFKFLKEKIPDSLIAREVNNIDITVCDNQSNNKIPSEIQKTSITHWKNNKSFHHSDFEDSIRRQIDDNIENYGKCWFFMDSEYLRYLQHGNNRKLSINLTWIIELMRENTLKIFAIKYDGSVKELTTKDFDFLKNISQTCSVGCDNDERVLNRNKLEIFYNVVNGYKFTQEEIIKYDDEFDSRIENTNEKSKDRKGYFMKSDNERCALYGYILESLGHLSNTNSILSCTIDKNKIITYGIKLGIFNQNVTNGNFNCAQIQFVDRFDVAQYFPGYIRNKEMWDYCKRKQRSFSATEFNGIATGTFNYDFIRKQSTMEDF